MKEHHINSFHFNNDGFPFSSRIICGVRGSTYRLYEYKIKCVRGDKYLRCSTFLGRKWTEVDGVMFTPRGKLRRTMYPKNKSYKHKPPVPRTMRKDCFIEKTQPKEWVRYKKYYKDDVPNKLYRRLEDTILRSGLIHV